MQLPERNTQSAIALAQTRRMKDGRFVPQTQGRKLRQETCPNMSKHVQTCRTMSNYVQTCRTMSNYVEICRNNSKYVEICRNNSKYMFCHVLCQELPQLPGQNCCGCPAIIASPGEAAGQVPCRDSHAMPCLEVWSMESMPWATTRCGGDRSKFGDGM